MFSLAVLPFHAANTLPAAAKQTHESTRRSLSVPALPLAHTRLKGCIEPVRGNLGY